MKRWGYALLAGLLSVSTTAAAQDSQRFTCTTPDKRVEQRIVGGQQAKPGDWPWQVGILIRTSEGGFLCGGSLIHPQWVLTAAHCVRSKTRQDHAPQSFTMFHGSHEKYGGQSRTAALIISKEDYRQDPTLNDIALIKLERPYDVSPAQIIKLQSRQLEHAFGQPGDCAVVTGWGRLQDAKVDANAPTAKFLQQVDVPLVDSGDCNQQYGGNITGGQLCAGYRQGTKDSCHGDSGGPLVVPGGPTGWTQVGIVSYGKICAQANAYGVYTRVSAFIDWIVGKTRGN
jgi:secreted trypsin-like serine protease